jgi:hypothetical protein
MPSPSKNKGSGFEREVAKFLSDLYQESFIRAPGSGAYVGGTNSSRKQTLHENQIRSFKGDIIPGESFTRFNAECKFYADFQFHQIFDDCRQLETWISQLMTASDVDDVNILFIKINRRGRFVVVQSNNNWNMNCNHSIYNSVNEQGQWIICNFEKFFELNSDQVKKLSNYTDTTSNYTQA